MSGDRTAPSAPEDPGGAPRPWRRRPPRPRRPRSRRYRRIRAVVLAALGVVVVWTAVSLAATLSNPAYGSSMSARLAEWFREHGASSIVNWAENEWYSHHPPPVGGRPPAGAIAVPRRTTSTTAPPSAPPHLPAPPPVPPQALPALPGEGQWSPAGRLVDGVPAVYVTTLRPDPVHTSYVAGVAWMDTRLLRATLYSGSIIPGGGPYTDTAPVAGAAADSLVAAFNAGFLMSNANGGYYTDGRTELPLVPGAASFVIHRDGSVAIGSWGSEVAMTNDVVSVRQNLDLLVDGGHVVPGLNAQDTTRWGYTLGNQVYVWRSGVGVTADGALVYVGGPGLNITDLANLLAAAGAVRAMELDINTDWVNYSVYAPSPGTPASAANGVTLLQGDEEMSGGPGRYFDPGWARDFFTMSAR